MENVPTASAFVLFLVLVTSPTSSSVTSLTSAEGSDLRSGHALPLRDTAAAAGVEPTARQKRGVRRILGTPWMSKAYEDDGYCRKTVVYPKLVPWSTVEPLGVDTVPVLDHGPLGHVKLNFSIKEGIGSMAKPFWYVKDNKRFVCKSNYDENNFWMKTYGPQVWVNENWHWRCHSVENPNVEKGKNLTMISFQYQKDYMERKYAIIRLKWTRGEKLKLKFVMKRNDKTISAVLLSLNRKSGERAWNTTRYNCVKVVQESFYKDRLQVVLEAERREVENCIMQLTGQSIAPSVEDDATYSVTLETDGEAELIHSSVISSVQIFNESLGIGCAHTSEDSERRGSEKCQFFAMVSFWQPHKRQCVDIIGEMFVTRLCRVCDVTPYQSIPESSKTS